MDSGVPPTTPQAAARTPTPSGCSWFYLAPFFCPLAVCIAYPYWNVGAFALPGFVACLIPVFDWMSGRGRAVSPSLNNLWLLRGWVILQTAFLLFSLTIATTQEIELFECWALGSAVALAVGVTGTAVAHELMHSGHRADRRAAWFLMILTGYPHFVLAHTLGHHRSVATPSDPATARLGEPLYWFLPRCVAGSFQEAWTGESRRLNHARRAVWGPANRMLSGLAWCSLLSLGIFAVFGVRGIIVFGAQALISTFYLETVNYVQHYGLVRRRLPAGGFEAVGACHSWDCDWRLTNWLLFNLGRHSDHHFRAGCQYSGLTHLPDAPRLPAGYTAMVVLALFPPVWHAIMDPRVREVTGAIPGKEA